MLKIIRHAFYVLTENMEISVAKKDTVISYNKCSHQAYFVWTLMLPSVSKVQHILQLEYQFFLGPPMLHSKILKREIKSIFDRCSCISKTFLEFTLRYKPLVMPSSMFAWIHDFSNGTSIICNDFKTLTLNQTSGLQKDQHIYMYSCKVVQ